jgi:hypothetical protein
MRKYQNRLSNWRRRIGVKICHFILRRQLAEIAARTKVQSIGPGEGGSTSFRLY